MVYKDLKTIFHAENESYYSLYETRFNAENTLHFDMNVSGHPAFMVMTHEIYELSIKAAKLDKEICKLLNYLPDEAIASYMDSCLIDEIVITNEIEGVNSTRKEIGEVLDRLKEHDKKGRFYGLVKKYLMLRGGDEIPLNTCNDIRELYDELVLPEVLKEDKRDAPDGDIFRKGPVSVVDATGAEIHHGLEPEGKIIAFMEKSLGALSDERTNPLARMSMFHFMFGYIHPFYNGNGRMNRFVSSYMISREYEDIVGLRLSYAVKDDIGKYYKAFSLCEHPLNKGDLTPFAITFSRIVTKAMKSMRDSLVLKRETLQQCATLLQCMTDDIEGKGILDISAKLVTATLYSHHGITATDLAKDFGMSRQTMYKRLKPLKDAGLLVTEGVGRKTYCRIDIDKLSEMYKEQ